VQINIQVVYVGIMGMTRAVWVGQERVWVGHGLPGLMARTASGMVENRKRICLFDMPNHCCPGSGLVCTAQMNSIV